jgi:hypothetical protein
MIQDRLAGIDAGEKRLAERRRRAERALEELGRKKAI